MTGTPVWPPALPRRLFLLWLQGEDSAPDLVGLCLSSWRQHHPNWMIDVLDEERALHLSRLSSLPSGLSPNHKANLIRLRLLARYGGVWADATTLCMRPLDDWLGRAAVSGFFCFSQPQPLRALANWFIASAPEQALTEAWRRWSEVYALSERPVASYFCSHHTLAWLLETQPALRRKWAEVPYVSARGPHVLQRLLDGDLRKADVPTAQEMAEIPLFKLNWKKGYRVDDVTEALSGYGLSVRAAPADKGI
jgi:hypothetical protein